MNNTPCLDIFGKAYYFFYIEKLIAFFQSNEQIPLP